MKKIILSVAVLILTLCASSAFAAKMEFKSFSIEVPKGWQVEEDEDSNTVAFSAPKGAAVLTITLESAEGKSAKEIAEEISEELDGGKPKKDGDGDYQISFTNDNGVKGNVVVSTQGKKFWMIMIVGEHDDLEDMINSLEEN
jgi:hypothetical protein